MKRTILLSNKYSGTAYEIIKSVLPDGFALKMLNKVEQEEFEKEVRHADYILASGRLRIDERLLQNACNLKMIQRTGVGIDTLDLPAIKKRNIPLYVNYGINHMSVAEHTLLLILACLKKLTIANDNVKNGIWEKQAHGLQTRELASRIVGIIGMGHIGRQVARLLKAFGATVSYYDLRRLSRDEEKELGVCYKEVDDIFRNSDIITFHCALTEQSKYIVNWENICKMREGVILINTARGEIIRENDLVRALKSGHVSFAGLDVFEEEPTNHAELLEMDNVIVTPHIGGVSYDAFLRMMSEAMRNIEMFEKGMLQEIEKSRLKE